MLPNDCDRDGKNKNWVFFLQFTWKTIYRAVSTFLIFFYLTAGATWAFHVMMHACSIPQQVPRKNASDPVQQFIINIIF